jgi:hypothetical protein
MDGKAPQRKKDDALMTSRGFPSVLLWVERGFA